MSELSEKELLLLSNYLYVDRSAQLGTIGDMLDSCRNENGQITADKLAGFDIGGCMSAEECADLFREMDKCSDDFKNLRAVRAINDGGIRGVCFADPHDSSKATVVFRGTGGAYEAWADDFRGEYLAETDMQKLADDFVRYDCGVYSNITVSGHSKGGNMAQFVTVTNRDRVTSCVSFDGQGFGRDAMNKYGTRIKDASGRIRSISGDKDYVNILLNPIAASREYVGIKGRGRSVGDKAVDYHSSYVLYKSCEFDETGRIINLTKQNLLFAGIADSMKRVVNGLDFLPKDGNRSFSELLGAFVSSGLTTDIGEENEKGMIREAVEGVRKYMAKLTCSWVPLAEGDVPVYTDSVYVDSGGLSRCISQMREACSGVEGVADSVTELRNKLNYRAASRLAVETILRKQENKLRSLSDQIARFTDTLDAINLLYTGYEAKLSSEIEGAVFK